MFGFAVPLQVGHQTRWWGRPLHEQGLPASMPGGLHGELAPGQRHLIAWIDLGLLRKSLPKEFCVAIEKAARHHLIPASRPAMLRLGEALNDLLDRAQAGDYRLSHPNAVESVAQDLLMALRQSLTLPLPTRRRAQRAVRQRGLRKALDLIRDADPGALRVADLCTAAGVTERTLQYAFRETFGLSPLGFLQLRRFQAARRELLAADHDTVTVNQIAQRYGFYDLGRFAVRYRARFGESPSDTLMQPVTAVQPYLRP
jgi:AraC family ethanolamine operon transcriptional activator